MLNNDVFLRKVMLADAGLIAGWFNDTENVKYMSTYVRCNKHSKETVEEEISVSNERYEHLFMVCLAGNGRPIGTAGIDDIDPYDNRGEIFFLIGEKDEKGKGHGKTIVRLLLDYAFKELGMNSLFATAAVKNEPSIALLNKSGFTKIGVRREYNNIDGVYVDEVFFDMTADEYLDPVALEQKARAAVKI
jgi:diamine N-acetyltransferase